MSEYQLAVYFWATLAALGLVAPLIAVLARETKKAVEHLHDTAPPSLTSAPQPSRPSCP
jgi:hypothetical protein